MNTPCRHKHGEYSDDYRHCTDCGQEWVLIGGFWFEVIAWVQVSKELIGDA